MGIYKHSKIPPWRIAGIIIRGIASSFRLWPMVLIAAAFISPVTPHIRWSYTYQYYGSTMVFLGCTYVGVTGFIDHMNGNDCPFFMLLDRNSH
jgi:hypothetical protein